MKNKECLECGKPATEDHHVIPRVLGGTVTVPLCGACHALVHGGYNKRRDNHVELTKEGLRRAKERGVVLGNTTNLEEAQAKGSQTQVKIADDFALSLKDILIPLREQGLDLRAIAESLNSAGVETQRGGAWHTSTICNIFKRLKRLTTASLDSTPTAPTSDLLVAS